MLYKEVFILIINGQLLSQEIRGNILNEVKELETKYGRVPHLVVILVGDNPASQSYVKGKQKACSEVGFKSTLIKMDADVSEEELLNEIKKINEDKDVDGLLVQLPLPRHINEANVINAISIDKDVDGFHLINVARLHLGEKCIKPCTPKGIMTMLKSVNIDVKGKHCVVLGRSNIVGRPMAELLLCNDATVTLCHSKTQNLKEITRNADILIVAIGKPKFVTRDYIKEGMCVIDVGVNRVDGHLCGDVDFDDCKDIASYITPVPKGVGPMTITSLMENTLELFKDKFN